MRRGAQLLLVLAVLLAGCGGSTSATHHRPAAAPAPCVVGKPVLPHVPGAPQAWQEGPGQPIALACLHGRRFSGAAIVGYLAPEAGSCVAVYNPRFKESAEQLCEVGKTPWTVQCEGEAGCIHAFIQGAGFTELDGPLEARVRSLRVSVDGSPLKEGVMIANVAGRLARSIKAREAFRYFAVFVGRCVVPDQVRIEFLGAGGSVLGRTRGWDVTLPPCKAGEGAAAG